MPLYRQETILKRIGVGLPRATLANWMIQAGSPIQPLIEIAKANRLEPYAYSRHLYIELPKGATVDAIEALLPGNLSKDQIRIG